MKLKEFAKKSRLKPWDLPIIGLLVLLSFTPFLIFGLTRPDPVTKNTDSQTEANQKIAILRVDSKEVKRWVLEDGKESYTYRYEDPDGDYNLIEIDGTRVRIAEANCGDQVCVRQGWIFRDGQTVVCLPHKLVVEVKVQGGGDDGLIY